MRFGRRNPDDLQNLEQKFLITGGPSDYKNYVLAAHQQGLIPKYCKCREIATTACPSCRIAYCGDPNCKMLCQGVYQDPNSDAELPCQTPVCCRKMCEHCKDFVCLRPNCSEHQELITCGNCQKLIHDGCSVECDVCNGKICEDCSFRCDHCENDYCESCRKSCTDCKKPACPKSECGCVTCHKPICDKCAEECHICEGAICDEHAKECRVCGHIVCESDYKDCPKCDEPSCTECLEDGELPTCKVCESEMCSIHLEECPSCEYNICDECQKNCDICNETNCTKCVSACEICGKDICRKCNEEHPRTHIEEGSEDDEEWVVFDTYMYKIAGEEDDPSMSSSEARELAASLSTSDRLFVAIPTRYLITEPEVGMVVVVAGQAKPIGTIIKISKKDSDKVIVEWEDETAGVYPIRQLFQISKKSQRYRYY